MTSLVGGVLEFSNYTGMSGPSSFYITVFKSGHISKCDYDKENIFINR